MESYKLFNRVSDVYVSVYTVFVVCLVESKYKLEDYGIVKLQSIAHVNTGWIFVELFHYSI